MAAAFHSKGQNCTLTMLKDGAADPSIANVRDASFQYENEIQKDGYLGEKTDRRSQVFSGVTGKLTMNYESKNALLILEAVKQRAQDNLIVDFTIKFQIETSDGTATVVIPNVAFGPIPVNFGSRSEKSTIELSFEAEDATILV